MLVAYRTPAAPSTARVSAWRTLHRMGALYLGPTVCLLPARLADASLLEPLGRRVEAAGGAFEVLAIEAFDDAAEAAVRARCNEARDAEYAEIVERAQALVGRLEREGARGKFTFAEVEENEADLAKLRRWLGRVTARDLFGRRAAGRRRAPCVRPSDSWRTSSSRRSPARPSLEAPPRPSASRLRCAWSGRDARPSHVARVTAPPLRPSIGPGTRCHEMRPLQCWAPTRLGGSSPMRPRPASGATARNTIAAGREEPWWEEVLESLREPLQLLLLVVGAAYFVLGEVEDALTILAVIVVVSGIEVVNEVRAKRAVASLSTLGAPTATAVRGGLPAELAAGEPGHRRPRPDRTRQPGPGRRPPRRDDRPSDRRVEPDRRVRAGQGLRRRAASGDRAGRPADDGLRRDARHGGQGPGRGGGDRPPDRGGADRRAGRGESRAGDAAPALDARAGRLARLAGPRLQRPRPGSGCPGRRPAADQMLLTGLTLAFATIPEELPILITIVLGIGAYRLAQRNAIVKHLRAAETLGAVSVVATDKTGTLTENRMRVAQALVDGRRVEMPEFGGNVAVERLITAAVLANDAQITRSDGKVEFVGDPTDTAFLAAASELGRDAEAIRGDFSGAR